MKRRRRYPVTVKGIDLVIENPGNPRTGKYLRDGEELPKDPWDNVVLVGPDGASRS
ncbi:hypothetical protein [Kineosporia succinea]|uniref:Uncharacterized protein n=1 Tax=Kineosporia succinea TaxID=84632 RepID=A0ABT9PCG4_9ACTN|nr:hypothetical protein [Kineosporia succinea]MDP9830395.1 hypothetical protein [Kineosporia succinea]